MRGPGLGGKMLQQAEETWVPDVSAVHVFADHSQVERPPPTRALRLMRGTR